MKLKLTVLGCGASAGVPAIGNFWGACDPHEPKNQRSRASVAVQSATSTLVIDTGPDFRSQLNRENIQQIDGVLYTHPHGDHVGGIDDLRTFQRRYRRSIPAYSHADTMRELEARFDYMFEAKHNLYPQAVEPHSFLPSDYGQIQTLAGIPFIPFEQDHTTCTSLGFRFGDIAYSTDMFELSDVAYEALQGVRVWIVDGAGHYSENAVVHASIPQIMEMNKKIGATEIYLTHLTLMMDYQELVRTLPHGTYPCYDGLVFETEV